MTGTRAMLALVAALVAASLTLAAGAPSAWAHTRIDAGPAPTESIPAPVALEVTIPAPPPTTPAPAAPVAAGPVLVLALAALLATRRRTIATALVPILIVLAVETGVHSVHHLSDRKTDVTCVVALASAHVHGTAESSPAPHDGWNAVPVGTVVAPAPDRPGARPLRPDEGRAPPAA